MNDEKEQQANVEAFPDGSDEVKVFARLLELGTKCTFEYPGFICIPVAAGEWNFGTANPKWCGDLLKNDAGYVGGVELDFASDSKDHASIALAIKHAVEAGEMADSFVHE